MESSCSCAVLLFPRVPPHVRESSIVPASGGGEGEGAGEGAAVAAASVVVITAMVINIITIANGTTIANIHPAIIITNLDGDVAMLGHRAVGRDSPPLFALLFYQIPCIHARWQKALLGGSPSPSLLGSVVMGVRRCLLRGDAASADRNRGRTGRGEDGKAAGREGVGEATSVPYPAPSSTPRSLNDAVPAVAVRHVVIKSINVRAGLALARGTTERGRLGAGCRDQRGAESSVDVADGRGA